MFENIFSKALDNSEARVEVNGIIVNNLRYADGTVVLASHTEELQLLMNKTNYVGKQNGLTINIHKRNS